MTKSELIENLVSLNPTLQVKSVEDGVKEILEQIMLFLERGERVEVRGFGSFLYIIDNLVSVVILKQAKA